MRKMRITTTNDFLTECLSVFKADPIMEKQIDVRRVSRLSELKLFAIFSMFLPISFLFSHTKLKIDVIKVTSFFLFTLSNTFSGRI